MRRWVFIGLLASLIAVSGATQTHDYFVNYVAPPGATTGFRAVDTTLTSGYNYFEGTWTVVHDGNLKGEVRMYDLYEYPAGATAYLDSAVDRLLPSVTYNKTYVGWDSIAVCVWDTDDTCYVYCIGDYKDAVNVHGSK